AGLTAAVIRDKQSGEFFLEAGAMVLADGGIVAVDEIDKMREEDRVAIHEAMEQGTVTISKAGIHARLSARASVLAAGNPKRGRYVDALGLSGNINLPVTILSRFDLIFVVKDVAEIDRDKQIVRHVLEVHSTEGARAEIPPDLLRKYIAYARKYVKPKLTDEAKRIIENYYIELRKRSAADPNAPLAITTRQLEALIRLSEAHAKMALKNEVEAEDALEAVRLMNAVLERVGMDVETGMLDIDILMSGKAKSLRDKEIIILERIRERSKKEECTKYSELEKIAEALGIDRGTLEKIIHNLKRSGDIYEPRTGCYMLQS
ncbi:MAG: minichromosome maintenance protein MCM, partial [Sulfolobales archaeon]